MKNIKQFRYYGNGNASNYPQTLNDSLLSKGNIFSGIGSISQLGIQGRPGTIFYLNNSIYPIVIGATGIYELDLKDLGSIYAIRFSAASLNGYNALGSSAQLLIDIVYEGSGAEV